MHLVNLENLDLVKIKSICILIRFGILQQLQFSLLNTVIINKYILNKCKSS